jgi:putative transposase
VIALSTNRMLLRSFARKQCKEDMSQSRRDGLFVVIGKEDWQSSIGAPCNWRILKMANTYSQIYIQIVFAVKGRQNLIASQHREQLQKYITGIVRNRDQKMLSVFSMPDHTHLLVSLKPSIAVSDLVRDVKADASNFINEKKWFHGKFNWQEGFGAFSYSRGELDSMIKYVLNQEIHHRKTTFREEYVEFLKKFGIDYDQKYLFEWIEECR